MTRFVFPLRKWNWILVLKKAGQIALKFNLLDSIASYNHSGFLVFIYCCLTVWSCPHVIFFDFSFIQFQGKFISQKMFFSHLDIFLLQDIIINIGCWLMVAGCWMYIDVLKYCDIVTIYKIYLHLRVCKYRVYIIKLSRLLFYVYIGYCGNLCFWRFPYFLDFIEALFVA